MRKTLKRWFRKQGKRFSPWLAKIREINRKYSQPRIKITPMVSFALLMLRLYLLFLVALLFYKFILLVR